MDKIEAKIAEFSALLEGDGLSLSAPEARAVAAVCEALANTSRWHATSVAAADVAALVNVANKWPGQQVGKGVGAVGLVCARARVLFLC